MTLVKSLHTGDPDVIGYNVDVIGLLDCWCYSDSVSPLHSIRVHV
jgi:hypothetical protein